ncbi:DUF1223 domain-containing protein [Amylibacter sp. IMCC11727]|uniref:DUF1223 domain-containing protein n=1 Tax=Amylibacter sp. IMCC11727 TaxID=3039851 RepID=UPI00244E295C|nr:DUF1223 domain-containing protein [Amylibacter sp. IMCC11727]WGI20239.1 DUF1223 domain-containing protein [Amylibacter sp. IMCC11727]
MRKLLASLALATLGFGSPVLADKSVVVVELYTSQGCSSCPPADEILAEIAGREDVIALGLHVDYWDYLGWRDNLARPEFTERQSQFNTKMKSRYRLVTPQMIFNGEHYVAGASRKKALMYVDMMSESTEKAYMTLSRSGTTMEIRVSARGGKTAPSDLHVVQYTPNIPVKIKRGENAGRTINYVNTVTSWDTVARWDGVGALTVKHDVTADGKYAVVLQTQNLGPVIVARRLD